MSKIVKVDEIVNDGVKRTRYIDPTALDDDAADIVRKINATNVAEIATDADGTALATAVNGILAILVTAGLMQAGE